MRERIAVIDLGTNTFHLVIIEIDGNKLNTLYKEKIAVKIGKNGISKGKIAPDAVKRAIHTLTVFRTVIDQFEVKRVKGVATSAIRSAKNGKELIALIKEKTGINIEIISGLEEAALIYQGVRAAMTIPTTPQLIMDIGGGSVEFMIGTNDELLWSHSFEIGAQRLLDKFHRQDPIRSESIRALNDFLTEELSLLAEAINVHKPQGLIGCSGTFDTIKEIYLQREGVKKAHPPKVFDIPTSCYEQIHQELVSKDREARLQIPGMVSMRVDMIVVSSYLIHFVLQHINTNSITACAYALKEGLLFSDLGEEKRVLVDQEETE